MPQRPFKRRPKPAEPFVPRSPIQRHRPGQVADPNPPIKSGAGAATNRTDWSQVADWYDNLVGDEGSEYHRHVVLPGVLRLMAVKQADRVLDVACGQGVLCRLLQAQGAVVTGVDAAGPLIQKARERTPSPDARFVVADARELDQTPTLAAGSFDTACCMLAIQNIHPINKVFRGVNHCLKVGGHFVIAMMHPCFRVPKQSHWGWDEKTGRQYRRVDHYLLPRKERIITNPGIDPDTATWAFHRPIQFYFDALRAEGFVVDTLEEWASHKKSDSGPRAPAENIAREEIPMFMAIRAIKTR